MPCLFSHSGFDSPNMTGSTLTSSLTTVAAVVPPTLHSHTIWRAESKVPQRVSTLVSQMVLFNACLRARTPGTAAVHGMPDVAACLLAASLCRREGRAPGGHEHRGSAVRSGLQSPGPEWSCGHACHGQNTVLAAGQIELTVPELRIGTTVNVLTCGDAGCWRWHIGTWNRA